MEQLQRFDGTKDKFKIFGAMDMPPFDINSFVAVNENCANCHDTIEPEGMTPQRSAELLVRSIGDSCRPTSGDFKAYLEILPLLPICVQ